MGIFEKLFGSRILKTTDTDFGEIESVSIQGNNVCWTFKKQFLNSNIEVLINGNKENLSELQKQILINALNSESEIKSEVEKALKDKYLNAEMEFESIEKHFAVSSLSVNNIGFELTFQEKNAPYYYFNIHFENNKQIGVSIDG